jgi:DNA-binding XRE family transcriptional regulator
MKISLKACRVNVKASVKEEARAIGVSEDTVYKWEGGRCAPRLGHAQKLIAFYNSKGFNVSLDDINFLL